MAVLGSSPESYAEYREKIRGEYSFLSEPMYTALRLKVIISLNELYVDIFFLIIYYSLSLLYESGTAKLCADSKYFCNKGISRKV